MTIQRKPATRVVAVLALMLGAGVATVPAAAQDGKIVIGINETGAEYWTDYVRGARNIADSLGQPLEVLVSNYQGAQLMAQLSATLATGCDGCALVMDPTSNAFTKAIVQRAADADKPIVTIWNRPEEIRPYENVADYWVAHITYNEDGAGYEQAMALCKTLNGKGKIGVIEGVPSSSAAIQQMRGLQRALKECPGLEVLDHQAGDWQQTKAQGITRTWAARYGEEMQGIFSSNDAMAKGVVAALKERGLDGKVLVTGVDGSLDALRMVRDGQMLMTVWLDPQRQGATAAALAHAAVVGDIDLKTMSPDQRDFYLNIETVTRDNVDKFLKLKENPATYSYEEMKKNFWQFSAGQIQPGDMAK